MLKKRKSGVLLHVTSLPSSFGIGDLGPDAYSFVDFLYECHQRVWQLLPLNPTITRYGNSPYNSPSAFAGNPLLLSPLLLYQNGLVSKSDIEEKPEFSEDKVDYRLVTEYKEKLFSKAVTSYLRKRRADWEYLHFCEENSIWLDDFALFGSLKSYFRGKPWNQWPSGIRDRKKGEIAEAREMLKRSIAREKTLQYLFFRQWKNLKAYCNEKDVQVFGDLPIYVNYESADVWAHPQVFKLDKDKRPTAVTGVPPDYFSKTGQLWGNPVYDWERLKDRGYSWWIERIAHNLSLYDIIRMDHFRGFVDFWEVPAREKTAVNGRWIKGPREDFFNSLLNHFPSLPLVAEDLGNITSDVREVRDMFQLPGMRILQFAFSSDPSADYYKPHSYIENCVAYTGTHDNNTLMGWLREDDNIVRQKLKDPHEEKKRAFRYIGCRSARKKNIHWDFIRALMMSSARMVIIPMQDLLGLGEEARMNYPSTSEGNWEWRISAKQFTQVLRKKILDLTEIYGRA
jgi:4-alpha-glucanotransferase